MTISFEIPPEIADELRVHRADLGQEAKEALTDRPSRSLWKSPSSRKTVCLAMPRDITW
jgi:hypothetical protein